MKLPVRRIIPFSNVEGVGNRTSIFVQGCNVNCLYCHNPETIPRKYDDVTFYEVDDLVEIIKGNMPFIRGITVSGGEATLYPDALVELFSKVKPLGLSCYVDTNGFFDFKRVEALIDTTDKFLFDIKALGQSLEALCFSNDFLENTTVTVNKDAFVNSDMHLENFKRLLELEKVEEVRLVYIKCYYEAEMVVDKIAEILADYHEIPFKLIRVHAKGLPRERAVGLKGCVPTKDEYKELVNYAKEKMNKVIEIL